VTVYGVCPPDPFQRCSIDHGLACSAPPLPDLWPLADKPAGLKRAPSGPTAAFSSNPIPETLPDAG
jgi:hypothetical protein